MLDGIVCPVMSIGRRPSRARHRLVGERVEGSDTEEEFEPDYRFTLANERTFLAWERTVLGSLAAAVAVVQLVPELAVPWVRQMVGGILAALAILTSAAGLRRWGKVDGTMRRGLPRRRVPLWLGAGLLLVARHSGSRW
jgi:putative membrane protein